MAANEAGAPDGRPLTRRGRETRQRIVVAAAELMFENGVAETTLEDIRAAAGVSGSQVYHYFEDKQALVRAVIDYQAGAVLDTQGAHLDRLDTMPGLRAWRDFLVGHQRRLGCRGGCPVGALGAEVAETDAAARLAAARGLRRWEARIRDGLLAMHARGDLPAAGRRRRGSHRSCRHRDRDHRRGHHRNHAKQRCMHDCPPLRAGRGSERLPPGIRLVEMSQVETSVSRHDETIQPRAPGRSRWHRFTLDSAGHDSGREAKRDDHR